MAQERWRKKSGADWARKTFSWFSSIHVIRAITSRAFLSRGFRHVDITGGAWNALVTAGVGNRTHSAQNSTTSGLTCDDIWWHHVTANETMWQCDINGSPACIAHSSDYLGAFLSEGQLLYTSYSKSLRTHLSLRPHLRDTIAVVRRWCTIDNWVHETWNVVLFAWAEIQLAQYNITYITLGVEFNFGENGSSWRNE